MSTVCILDSHLHQLFPYANPSYLEAWRALALRIPATWGPLFCQNVLHDLYHDISCMFFLYFFVVFFHPFFISGSNAAVLKRCFSKRPRFWAKRCETGGKLLAVSSWMLTLNKAQESSAGLSLCQILRWIFTYIHWTCSTDHYTPFYWISMNYIKLQHLQWHLQWLLQWHLVFVVPGTSLGKCQKIPF